MNKKTNKTTKILCEGGIICYPTEGVFGFGCDPLNETAVLRLLRIKKRSIKKGLVLIAANWKQAGYFIKGDIDKYKKVTKIANKPTTWIFSTTPKTTPLWIRGGFDSVAIRITTHSVAKKICQSFGGAIVSTSANIEGEKPAMTSKQARDQFGLVVDYVVAGNVGGLKKPTEIRDIKTKKIIRV